MRKNSSGTSGTECRIVIFFLQFTVVEKNIFLIGKNIYTGCPRSLDPSAVINFNTHVTTNAQIDCVGLHITRLYPELNMSSCIRTNVTCRHDFLLNGKMLMFPNL